MDLKEYSFKTESIAYQSIETKSGRKFFVTGYLSVPEVDVYNDLVTEKCFKSMLEQISSQSIKLDYEHEKWRDNETLLPVGKIIEGSIDDRGLFIKCELNKNSPKFKALWGSIKDKFIDAFSIAFKPIKTVMKTIDGVQVRVIDDLKLLNVALTGMPVCEGAKMTGFGMKSVFLKAINELEQFEENYAIIEKSKLGDKTMTEKELKSEEKIEEQTKEESKEESKVEEKTEESKVEENKVEEKSYDKEIAELKSSMEKVLEENASVKAELKALKEAPVMKSKVEEKPEVKSQEEKLSSNTLMFV